MLTTLRRRRPAARDDRRRSSSRPDCLGCEPTPGADPDRPRLRPGAAGHRGRDGDLEGGASDRASSSRPRPGSRWSTPTASRARRWLGLRDPLRLGRLPGPDLQRPTDALPSPRNARSSGSWSSGSTRSWSSGRRITSCSCTGSTGWTPSPRRRPPTRPARRSEVRTAMPTANESRLAVAGLGLPGRAGPPAVPRRAGGGVPDRRPVGRAPDLLGPLDLAGGPRRLDGRGLGRYRVFLPDGPRRPLRLAGQVPDLPHGDGPAGEGGHGAAARAASSPGSSSRPIGSCSPGSRSEPVGYRPLAREVRSVGRVELVEGRATISAEVGAGRGLLARARAAGRGRPRPARRLARDSGTIAFGRGRGRRIEPARRRGRRPSPGHPVRPLRLDPDPVARGRSRAVPLDAPGRPADPGRRAPVVPRLPRPSRGRPGRARPLPEGREAARSHRPGEEPAARLVVPDASEGRRRSSRLAMRRMRRDGAGPPGRLVPPDRRGPRRPRVRRDRHRLADDRLRRADARDVRRRRGPPRPEVRGVLSGRRRAGGRPGGGEAGAFLVDAETRLNPSLAAGYFGARRSEVAATKPQPPTRPTSPASRRSTATGPSPRGSAR